MAEMTEELFETLTTKQKAFCEACENLERDVEMFRQTGFSSQKPSVRAKDQADLMGLLSDLTDEGVDVRNLRFDNLGSGYHLFHV